MAEKGQEKQERRSTNKKKERRQGRCGEEEVGNYSLIAFGCVGLGLLMLHSPMKVIAPLSMSSSYPNL